MSYSNRSNEEVVEVENAEEKDLEDERMKMLTENVEDIRMSKMVLLILITWMMNGNRQNILMKIIRR